MNNLAWWGLFFGLCLFLELSSPGYFFFLAFSMGALAAVGVTWFQLGTTIQGSVFLGVSALSLLILRRYAARIAKEGYVKTNVYALQGKKGVVLEQVTPLTRGWIKVDGETWAALPYNDISIDKGAIIEVVSSAGSHLKVKKLEDNSL